MNRNEVSQMRKEEMRENKVKREKREKEAKTIRTKSKKKVTEKDTEIEVLSVIISS
jgi:hypothetical protein